MRSTILALCLVALAVGVARATEVPTTIDADTTWTAADSPYEVRVDARVAEGVALVVEPGVTVAFAADTSLLVAGTLSARGTDDAPIVFTGLDDGAGPARWGSVVFEETAAGAVYEGLDVPVGGSIVESCVFEHATRALRLESASPYVGRSTFRDNRCVCGLDFAGGAAILVGEGSRARIHANTFEDNRGDGLCYGGAIYVDRGDPIIQGNRFVGNTAAYGGALSTFFMAAPIVGNVFEGNESLSEGGALSLVSSVPAILGNRFVGNHAYQDGGGVHVCVTCFPHANPFLHDNTVTGNTNEKEGAAGVGAAFLRGFSDNNLHGNLREGEPADFGWFNEELDHYPAAVVHPDVSGNWWGTTDPDAIATTIFDGTDEEGLGEVSYLPPLEAPVTAPKTRVTVTTRKLRYTGVGEPLPLFVTIWNPGPARDVDLALILDYGEGRRAYHRGPFGIPGETWGADTVRLSLPEDGVFFAALPGLPYPGKAALPGGTWHAALLDAEDGQPVGEVCSITFELADAPGIEPGEGE